MYLTPHKTPKKIIVKRDISTSGFQSKMLSVKLIFYVAFVPLLCRCIAALQALSAIESLLIAHSGDVSAVEKILQNDVHGGLLQDGFTSFHPHTDLIGEYTIENAAFKGDEKQVRLFLKYSNINPADETKIKSALLSSVLNGHTEVLKVLLADERVDPGYDNDLLLHTAIDDGLYPEVIRLLLESDKVNPASRENLAIKEAAKKKPQKIAELLLATGKVDVSSDHYIAYWNAVDNKHSEIATMIQKYAIERDADAAEKISASPYKNECPICITDFDGGPDFHRTICNHRFHRSCIALVHDSECPLCRTRIIIPKGGKYKGAFNVKIRDRQNRLPYRMPLTDGLHYTQIATVVLPNRRLSNTRPFTERVSDSRGPDLFSPLAAGRNLRRLRNNEGQ
jgi:uncharacterized membrane protein